MRNGQRSPQIGASGGFTLIEVLVALAVLAVGIFALIELFPPGFFTIQVAANDTAANNLARAELERLSANNVNQLEGVYAVYQNPTTGLFSYNPLDLPNSHLADATISSQTDIDAERAIQGEQVRIPPATSVTPEGGGSPVSLSLYVPNFAPIEMPTTFVGNTISQTNGTSTNPNLVQDNYVLKVSSLPWSRIVGDSNYSSGTNPNFADPNAVPAGGSPQYLVDYGAMKLAIGPEFPTAPGAASPAPAWYFQPFNFSVIGTDNNLYTATFVWDPGNQTGSTTYYNATATTNGPAGPQWFQIQPAQWVNVTQNTTGSAPPGWQPGTEKLWRDFNLVYNPFAAGGGNTDLADYLAGKGGTWSTVFGNDPYSYAIVDPELGTGSGNTLPATNLGAIAFNPTAAKIKDAHGYPLMAEINYAAADWHIIHEDHTLGTTALEAPTVRLTLPNLIQLGDALPDNTIYGGIVSGMASPTDIDVVDLDTGQSSADVNPPASLTPTVDYNNGVVTFPTSASGSHVRILYKATGDWGLAIVKAPSTYQVQLINPNSNGGLPPSPYPAPTPSTLPVCYVAQGTTNPSYLYFPPTDEGKMVQITDVVGSNGVLYSDARVRMIEPGPTVGGTPKYGFVDLAYNQTDPSNDPDGDKGVLPSGVGISSVGSVTGASITARVVWKDRSNWRFRDITTLTAPAE